MVYQYTCTCINNVNNKLWISVVLVAMPAFCFDAHPEIQCLDTVGYIINSAVFFFFQFRRTELFLSRGEKFILNYYF
jgi:hypothetical protein